MSEEPRKDPIDIRLQQFGLKDTSYERPNQNWVCGRLCEGAPCTIGPDAKGHCIATAECRPAKKGDRWVCTRRDGAGGTCPCGEGPLPDGSCSHPITQCSPVRSLRSRRARFAFSLFALSVGVLCFFLFGSDRSAFVAPGNLTDAHAQILKARRASDCSACHAAGEAGAGTWLKLALAPSVGAVQNDKCLVCHRAELGEDAALPHSLPKSVLQRIGDTERISGPTTGVQMLALFAPAVATAPGGQLACATCHQEHGGRHQNIEALADISCQICHKTQFASFANGHPEFKAVHDAHTGILFDHALHASRMPNGKLVCATCHRPDATGRTMQFTSFEQACAECHAQGSFDHHGDQIRNDIHVVLQLPYMSLNSAGNWPDSSLAPGDTLKPMLQFLIAGDSDPASINALKSLNSDVVAAGSTDDWGADDKTKAILATAIKRVINELSPATESASGPSNRELLRARIARAAGVPPESPAVSKLLDQLLSAGDLIRAWREHSLPKLADDLAGKIKPSTAPAPAAPVAASGWSPPKNASGWFIDPTAVSVNYRPHHADALDKSWIDVLAAGASSSAPPKIAATMSNQNFLAALRVELLSQHGGSCIKCHSIQSENGSYFVNWYAAENTARPIGYAKFDHRPHLTLITSDDKCSICHKLQVASQSSPPVKAALFPIAAPNHGLAPHDKASCVVCHNPTGAPDTCLTCHEYHLTR